MLRGRSTVAAAGIAVAVLLLAGCAVVDKYADRAVDYNLQAEKTQQQNLLLNIIRASLRRPMQFTGLTSITGTASASGTLGGGYGNTHQTPVAQDLGANIPATLGSISNQAIGRIVTGTGTASGTMSGGPTFTVPVLDTQEFYQGILAPVSHQIIDYYVKQGYPPQILFDLFVASVDVIRTDSKNCERFTFRNDVRDFDSFAQFQALAEYLIVSGFTTERISEQRPFGPDIPMSRRQLNATQAAQMVEAYSRAAAAGLEFRRARPAATRPGSGVDTLHLQKRTSRYRFCFTRDVKHLPNWLGPPEDQAYCGHSALPRRPQHTGGERCGILTGGEQGAGEGGTSQFTGIKLSREILDRLARIKLQSRDGAKFPENFFPIETFRNRHVTFQFNTRSVEGILYYLGEITRQHLGYDNLTPRFTQIKTGLRYGVMPRGDCGPAGDDGVPQKDRNDGVRLLDGRPDPARTYNCDNFFVLDTGLVADTIYSVSYNNQTYLVPTDPARAGRTLQVLELVKQLLALHISAKQLPQSSVISIIGGTAQ